MCECVCVYIYIYSLRREGGREGGKEKNINIIYKKIYLYLHLHPQPDRTHINILPPGQEQYNTKE